MVRDKIRIRFRKGGDLRLVSHHDLMRCFERMLRRAALPFRSTEGFNPKPRLVFALSLGLGIIGCEEVAEVALDGELPPEEIHNRLAHQAPSGLEILAVKRIDPRVRAHVFGASYRIAVPAERHGDVSNRAADLLARADCWVDRQRPRPRRFDLRPYLRDLHLEPDCVIMDLWVTPQGTVRPNEVLAELGLADLLESGVVLERIKLELQDESSWLQPDESSPGCRGTVLVDCPAAAPNALVTVAALPSAVGALASPQPQTQGNT
jgi:radical SAM-linked protein